MQWRNPFVLRIALGLASLSLAACAQGGGGQAPVASGEVVVRTSEWKFEPGTFSVEAGKSVTLVLRNVGKIEHDLKVSSLTAAGKEVELAAKAGEAASVEFTPDKPGIYEITCTLPGHKSAGMVGKLEVVAAKS